MKIIMTEPAQSDLMEIARYIAEETGAEAAGLKELERLKASVMSLGEMPGRAPLSRLSKLRRKGFRVLVCEPYLIFYRVNDQRVTVHRILHEKQDYKTLLN